MPGDGHRGWHSRGYLPHFDGKDVIQALTFRLADALPVKVVESWKQELESGGSGEIPETDVQKKLRKLIARYEDAGHGECTLRDAKCAEIVQSVMLHFDGQRYQLIDWCVMPNHVHAMLCCNTEVSLGRIVQSWKVFSARRIHAMLGRTGSLWYVDYHDRYIRNGEHFESARHYIRQNPVKAGLCRCAEDWPWSSASVR